MQQSVSVVPLVEQGMKEAFLESEFSSEISSAVTTVDSPVGTKISFSVLKLSVFDTQLSVAGMEDTAGGEVGT